jgi:predicted secreted acid phosphatase
LGLTLTVFLPWGTWIPENKVTASPGSLDFLKFCAENGVEVFYVTSRDQGEKTYEYAMGHLKVLGFPYADEKHLTVLRDTSNKEKRQDEIMKDFNVDERLKMTETDREKYGRNYIVFPNPTDEHWLAAIFGESEPPPTDANRAIMKKAATKSAW